MDKTEMSFECKFWGCFCSICELDGKDCDGDDINCPNYVDRNDNTKMVKSTKR